MTTSQESFYDSIDGALTPEQAAQAYALAASGDTGATAADDGGAPATTTVPAATGAEAGTEKEQQQPAAQGKPDDGKTVDVSAMEVDESQIDPTKAVVLAKDGKHTIPYDRLEKARQGEQQWKAAAETAQRQLADLQAQAQARADAGQAPTKTDNMAAQAAAAIEAGVDADLFGDFSEAALAAGIQKLVERLVEAQVDAKVAKAVQPLQTKHQQDESANHYEAIYKAHPNADSIVGSTEFKAWVDGHPSVVRDAYWSLFDGEKGGSAAQIVEVFDAYTKATTQKPSQPTAADPKAAAQAAVASARVEPPSSLSSIPGGHASGASALDATADMSGPEMLTATQHMSKEQIEAWLNRTS